MEFKYVKMFFTMDYDTLDSKSRRPLLRAYQKAGVNELIENGCPFVLGYVCDGMLFDCFTNRQISISGNLVEINDNEFVQIVNSLGNDKAKMVTNIIKVMFFDENINLGFDITDMYEIGDDRRLQWQAYQIGLSDISPYDRDKMNDYTIAKIKRYNSK